MIALLLLKILMYILLSVIGVVLLVILLPLHISLRYRDSQFSVYLHLIHIPIKVYPLAKRDKKPEKTTKTKKKAKTEKTSSLPFDKQMIVAMIPPAMRFLRSLPRSLVIRKVRLLLVVAKDDPKDTAIAAGRSFAAILSLQKLMSLYLRIAYKKVKIIPDFLSEYTDKTEFDCKIIVFPCILLVASATLLIRILKIMRFTNNDNNR
ncbi:MAG: hypothetical protein FWG21_01875 [Oscillospiraceae bacterium]|nr:hypothetical protein [Oscillospiraceae bacterium]